MKSDTATRLLFPINAAEQLEQSVEIICEEDETALGC